MRGQAGTSSSPVSRTSRTAASSRSSPAGSARPDQPQRMRGASNYHTSSDTCACNPPSDPSTDRRARMTAPDSRTVRIEQELLQLPDDLLDRLHPGRIADAHGSAPAPDRRNYRAGTAARDRSPDRRRHGPGRGTGRLHGDGERDAHRSRARPERRRPGLGHTGSAPGLHRARSGRHRPPAWTVTVRRMPHSAGT